MCINFQSSSVVMNQRVQNVNAIPKITVPNSALIAASRPIRDPRLRRQQPNQNTIVNSNVQLESKPQVDSTNKIVSNKFNVRDSRIEPRSITNKDSSNISAPSDKIKSVSSRPFPKSRSKLQDESVRKLVKTSNKTLDSENVGDSAKSNSATISLDSSPTKVKRDKKTSPVKSPLKIKKINKDTEKKVSPTKQSPIKGDKSVKGDVASPTFKDIKQSMKNRNYMRRNRKTSESPEATQDVDLRVGGPPEKQPPQSEPLEDKSKSLICFLQYSDIHLFLLVML